MRPTTVLRLTVVAFLFGVLGFSCLAQDQNTDDVAAAARKAREQQKAAPKPKKVVTNDDIPPAPATAPSGDANTAKVEGPQATTTPSATDDKAAENDPKSEAYWHKRFQELHDKLANAQKELDLLQRELDKNQVQYYSDPQKALTEQHDRSDINEKTAKIDAKKKEIDSINQKISDLEDALRKAGGDPGWAR